MKILSRLRLFVVSRGLASTAIAALALPGTSGARAEPSPSPSRLQTMAMAPIGARGALAVERRASFTLDPARVICDEGTAGAYPVPTLLRLQLGLGSSTLRGLKPDMHVNVIEAVHQAPGARCADFKALLSGKEVPATLAQALTEELGRNPAGECLRAFHEATTIVAGGVAFQGNARFIVRPAEGCPAAPASPRK